MILLTDAEVIFPNPSRTTLESAAYSVLTAADRQEALDVASTSPGPVDLLLTAVGIPRASGLSAWQNLSSRPNDLKVLFLTNGESGRFEALLTRVRGLPAS